MPKYYVLIDKNSNVVKGHTFSSNMYIPGVGEEVVTCEGNWPETGLYPGDSERNSKCRFDKIKNKIIRENEYVAEK